MTYSLFSFAIRSGAAIWKLTKKSNGTVGTVTPGKFCNRLLTEILTEVPISHSLTEFNQPFNR